METDSLNTRDLGAGSHLNLQTVVVNCLRGLGYELVEMDWRAGGNLRVFIEHAGGAGAAVDAQGLQSEGPVPEDGSGIRIEDCERVSRQLSHLLTVENFDYARLEVSSPGLDRPLRGRADFERFMGAEITLKLKFAVAGRRNFEGRLVRADGDGFVIELIDRAESGAGRKGGRKQPIKAGGKAVRRPGAAASAQEPVAAAQMKFDLDEIERARLVPNFKF